MKSGVQPWGEQSEASEAGCGGVGAGLAFWVGWFGVMVMCGLVGLDLPEWDAA